jgi:hypothetical protein
MQLFSQSCKMPTALRVTSSVSIFIKVGRKPYKITARFHLSYCAKYVFHCNDFHRNQKCPTASRADFCTGFHPNRSRNTLSTGRNSFRPLCKVWPSLNRFSRNSHFLYNSLKQPLYRISRKSYKRFTRLTSDHKQTDRRGVPNKVFRFTSQRTLIPHYNT